MEQLCKEGLHVDSNDEKLLFENYHFSLLGGSLCQQGTQQEHFECK